MKAKYTTNMDIREYMADQGVGQRAVAAYIGVNAVSVCDMLKTEMTEAQKAEFIRYIDAVVAARNEDVTARNEDVTEEPEASEEPETQEVDEGVAASTKFQLGDRVKIPSKSLCIGIVCDIWQSLAQNKLMYAVETDGGNRGLYAEEQLEPAPLPIEYTFSAVIEDNVAVVCMIAHQGEKTWVHARGHAHILHDGAVGMAQAVSYASKRMFESLDKAQPSQIYFKNEGAAQR